MKQAVEAATAQGASWRLCYVAVFLTSIFLSGCAGDFAVRRIDPLRTGVTRFAANKTLEAGVRAQRLGAYDEAVACYLSALENPPSNEQRTFVTARLVELCAPRLLRDPKPLVFAASDGSFHRYRVTLRRGQGKGGIDPATFTKLQPCDGFAVARVPGGDAKQPGPGAALVASLPPVAPLQETDHPTQPISGLCWSATAVAVFGPAEKGTRSVALELYEPHDTEKVAGDFTTPMAVSESLTQRFNFGPTAFFQGDKYFGNAGLYPLENPSPDKTPVVLVHGLLSDPSTFRKMAHALISDPELRRHYQIWVFFYPSGLPVIVSSALLRDSLAKEMQKLDPARNHPALHRAVLVGHSMGGLVSRLIMSDSRGDKFYRFYFSKPFAQLQVDAQRRAKIRTALFFHPSPDVRSVVFIATPHRGSQLAHSPIGSLGRVLVSLPRSMATHMRAVVENNSDAITRADLGAESSIFNLKPESTLVRAMASLPMRTKRLYTIIGNRGRPGPLTQSSDGVVPYSSSHLPEAQRETIVPFGHTGTLLAPDTTAEVARVLRENPNAPLLRKAERIPSSFQSQDRRRVTE